MATESIIISVSENGSRVVKRNLEDIGVGADTAATAVKGLQGALGLLGTAFAVEELIKTADAYTSLQNKIRQYTTSTEQLASVYAELFNISQDTRTSLEANGQLYQRLALSMRGLGATQQDVLTMLKQINEALQLSSPSAQEAKGGLIQFTQAMSQGVLRGQELRSVLQELPQIADIIAKGMGRQRAELHALGEQGLITSKVVFDAFKKFGPELDANFTKVIPTVSSAFTVLNNAFINFLGQLNATHGASLLLSTVIITLAKNFDLVALSVIGLAGIAGLALLISSVATIAGAIGSLFGVFAGLIAIINAVITAVAVLAVLPFINPFAAALIAVVVGVLYLLYLQLEQVAKSLGGWEVLLNKVVGFFVGAVIAILATWKQLPAAFLDLGIQMANSIISGFGRGVQMINDFAKKYGVRDFGVAGTLQNVIPNPVAGTADKVGAAVRMSFEQAGNIDYTGDIKGFWDKLQKQFKEIANPKALADLLKLPIAGGSNSPISPAWTKQMESQFDALVKRLNPVQSAALEFAKDMNILNGAMGAGRLNLAQYNELVANLKTKYQDVLDPLGKVNRDLDRQAGYLKLTPRAGKVQQELDQTTDQLKEKGAPVNATQTADLKKKLETNQNLQDQQNILQSIKGPLQDYNTGMAALSAITKDITLDQLNQAARTLRITFLDTQKDFASGVERSFLKLADSAMNFAQSAETFLTSAFDKAGDAVADFALTGKLSIDSFFQDLARQLIKMGTNSAFAALGQGLFGSLANGAASGGSGGGASGGLLSGLGGFLSKGLGNLFGFASGGSFEVGGTNTGSLGYGIDNRLVAFRARAGETVTVNTPGTKPSGGNTIVFQVNTPDADSFRRSQGQLYSRAAAAMGRANRRNN